MVFYRGVTLSHKVKHLSYNKMDDKLAKMDEENSQTSSEVAATWNTAQEVLLAAIADRANGMRWMHSMCERVYAQWNFYLTVPAILMSTIAGSATIGMSSLFPGDKQQLASNIIGCMTLSTGVLTTLNQYMKSSQLSETHRVSSVAYGKLHRVISCELALRRDQRPNALEFLKIIRTEQDKLQDVSPEIIASVVRSFRETFKDRHDLEKPEIAGDLDHVLTNHTAKNNPTDSGVNTPLFHPTGVIRVTPESPSPNDRNK